MKGPELLLRGQLLTFRDPVHPQRQARLDSTYRVWIGHDAFYFASHDSRERFLKEPLRYVRMLSDPVTEQRFHPTAASPRLEYRGRPYYFAAESTRARFRAHPDYWAQRGPMDEAMTMTGARPSPAPHHVP